ncbi:MAG TPA: NAD-dependent epimerase/dehydratase family protein [Candidatus Acidoferrales bacterium]|nr:NAD-dependent epimerase/dehydratase family protein [Candidatus Acidoferrales bacterium]
MKALVTGGAGFIGSHIADALLARGCQVRVLDNLELRVHPRGRPAYLSREIEFIEGDVRGRATMERALAGVDAVFHQAAYQDYMPDYSKFFHSNVVSTALIFEIVRELRLPVSRIVVASSQSVYGEGQYHCPEHGLVLPDARPAAQLDRGEWDLCCPDCRGVLTPVLLREARANPAGPYGVSKLAQELAALRLGRMLGIHTVALRYSIVQGPRQSFYNAYSGICRIFTRAFLAGRVPVIFEDGKQLRDYVHIADVVAANLLVLDDLRADGQAFNVGSGQGTSVLDYEGALRRKMNASIAPVIPGSYRVGDVRHTVSSVAKLQALGWSVTKDLDEIFTDYLAWLNASPDPNDYFTQAFQDMQRSGVVRRATVDKGSAAAV